MDDIIDMEVGICSPSYADPDPNIYLHGIRICRIHSVPSHRKNFVTFLHSLFKHTVGSKTFFEMLLIRIREKRVYLPISWLLEPDQYCQCGSGFGRAETNVDPCVTVSEYWCCGFASFFSYRIRICLKVERIQYEVLVQN